MLSQDMAGVTTIENYYTYHPSNMISHVPYLKQTSEALLEPKGQNC